METCFLNLSFSLVVAFLVVASTLEARTYTTTDKGAEGITLTGGSYSTGSGTQEQEGDTAQSWKTAASSAPAVTRSMHTETSTLHRRSGWRQTAGNFATGQTEASTVTGRNLLDESTLDSTELPWSTELTEATAVPSHTDWEDLPTPGQLRDISSPSTLSLKSAPWTATEGRGSPSLRPGPESSQGWALAETTPLGAPEHTDSTYISTTLSRAGERTLLSVTSTSSSSSSSLSSSSSSSSSLSSSSSSSSSLSSSSLSSFSSSLSSSSSSSSSSSLSSSSSSSSSSSLSSSSSSSSSSSAFSNSSSTSGFTEMGSYGSERSLSTQALGDIVSTEDSTGKAPSTRADDRDSTVKVVLHHHTSSQREEHYGTGSLEPLRVTEPLTEPPNPTHHQHQPSSISEETSSSAPPHGQTGTDVYGTSATDRPERVSAVVSPSEAGVPEASSPGSKSSERGGDSGFSSSATSVDVSTDNRSQTGVVSQTAEDQSPALGLTTAPPTVGASTTAKDDSSTRFLSRQSPFTTRTDGASIGVEVFTTMPTFVTHRSQVTTREEDGTRKPIASTAIHTQAPSRPPSLPPQPSSSSSSSTLNDRDVTPTQGIPTQQSATAAAPRASTPPAEPSSVAAPSSPRQPPSPGWTQSSPTVETTHHPTVVTPPSVLLTPATTTARLGTTTTTAPTTTTTTPTTTTPSTTTTSTSTVQSSSRTTAPQARSPPPPLAGSTPPPPPPPPAPPQTTARWKPGTSRATTAEVTSTVTTVTTETASPPRRVPGNPCAPNPCRNGGMCVSYGRQEFTCRCLEAWTGPNCTQDVDECRRSSCPAGSLCVNTRGSFSCECPLGFDLEDGRACSRAKTFLGTFSITRLSPDPVLSRSALAYETHRDIVQLLNVSLSLLRGYSRSTLSNRKEDGLHILAVHMFSLSANVTSDEVYNSVQTSLTNCSSTSAHCGVLLHHQLTYHVESLCLAQNIQCDTERSSCMDGSGTALCQCVPGYYKHNPDDLSCIECGDGYKLVNGTCVQCMFGFGGFNCSNFYKLIAIVVSPAGGALLLILIIALIFTCCKKDKNDINKIIFKSGDLSPFTDFPKGNRVSMEWGRETIEMQENGSTKNLLQMTDIYYSPALRNSELERNVLYPFTGLPGSRHSCIYPSQWNPSFISDDSRRRDYF